MILADLGPALPYALGALAGFLAGLLVGVVVGRVDLFQRISYWRQLAMAARRPVPPPVPPATAASPRREPAAVTPQSRMEAA